MVDSLISSNTADLTTSEAAFLGGFVGSLLVILLIFTVLVVIGGWRIFEKAGEKGWKLLIPFYGEYILFKILGMKKLFWIMLGVSCITSAMISANNIPVDFTQSQEVVNAQLDAVNWSEHIPYLVGLIISGVCAFALEIIMSIRMAKAFGKGSAYILGLIRFPEIVLMVLGYGKAKYDKKAVKEMF